MKKLYLKTEITTESFKEQIEYFIIKEDSYGIKIVKAETSNESKTDEIVFHNISNNENVISNIIDMFLAGNNDFEQIKYIIEDATNNSRNEIVA